MEVKEIETLSSELFSFFTSFGDNIDAYFAKEKQKKLYRYLGYFQNDLKRYVSIRKKLMDDLVSNDFDVNSSEIKLTVKDLKKRLSKLSSRLFKISSLTSTELSWDAESIVDRINQAQQEQRAIYLTQLDKLLNGQEIDKEQLELDGQRIYNELNSSISLISKIREKLK